MRELTFLFQEPGLIEAVADEINALPHELETEGYRSVWVADLMVDYDSRIGKPYAFMSSSFDKTYPLVIWALKFHMGEEFFDIPQASLTAVPLHEAFSWAYSHFILEDELPSSPEKGSSLTRQVLSLAAIAT